MTYSITPALAVRVPLHAREGLASFWSRMAMANGIESLSVFSSDMGVDLKDAVNGHPRAIQRVAALGGIAENDLARWSRIKMSDRTVSINGYVMPFGTVRASMLKICPHCLAERLERGSIKDVYVQAESYFPSVRTCAIHECALFAVPYDGHHLGAYDHCQRILENRSLILDERWNDERYRRPNDLQCYVLDGFTGQPTDFWFDDWELNAVARASEMIGGGVVFGSKVEAKSLSDADWHKAGQVGFDLLRAGKQELYAALGQLKLREGSRLQRSVRYLGMVYSWLFCGAKHLQFDPVKDLLREYAVENHPFGDGDLVFGKPCKKRRLHTLSSACVETKLHAATMTRILRLTGHLSEDQSSQEIGQLTFPAKGIQSLLDQINASLPQTKAQEFLNISRPQFNALKAEGTFRPVKLFEEARVTYDKADLLRIWKKLSRNAMLVTSSSEGMYPITRAANMAVCPASRVFKMLIDRELTNVQKVDDEKMVGSLRVCINELRSRLTSDQGSWIFRRELADILGIDDWGLKALFDLGYISKTRKRNSHTRKVADAVSRADVAEFLNEYISLKRLALDQDVSVQKMAHHLKGLGIAPVALRVGVRTQIFRTDQLPPKMREACSLFKLQSSEAKSKVANGVGHHEIPKETA
ncbi:MAG: TniQ family protein [Hyphomicrobiales bacterium]